MDNPVLHKSSAVAVAFIPGLVKLYPQIQILANPAAYGASFRPDVKDYYVFNAAFNDTLDYIFIIGHCTLGKSLNGNFREQSNIKWQFLKQLMMKS